MNKKIIIAALLGAAFSISSAQEVSAFDAGNMDSANPYGLTDDEKATLLKKTWIMFQNNFKACKA